MAALTGVVGAEAVREGIETVVDVAARLHPDRFRQAMRHLRRLLDSPSRPCAASRATPK